MINRYVKYVSLFSFPFAWVDWLIGISFLVHAWHMQYDVRIVIIIYQPDAACAADITIYANADPTKNTQYASIRMFLIHKCIKINNTTHPHSTHPSTIIYAPFNFRLTLSFSSRLDHSCVIHNMNIK